MLLPSGFGLWSLFFGNNSVDVLVLVLVLVLMQAMAAFDVPTGAGGVINDDEKQQLQSALAASWQAV